MVPPFLFELAHVGAAGSSAMIRFLRFARVSPLHLNRLLLGVHFHDRIYMFHVYDWRYLSIVLIHVGEARDVQ